MTITNVQGNSCFLLDSAVVLVRNILCKKEGTYIAVEKYSFAKDFYVYPLGSSNIGIFKVSSPCGNLVLVPAKQLENKCLLLPLNEREHVHHTGSE